VSDVGKNWQNSDLPAHTEYENLEHQDDSGKDLDLQDDTAGKDLVLQDDTLGEYPEDQNDTVREDLDHHNDALDYQIFW